MLDIERPSEDEKAISGIWTAVSEIDDGKVITEKKLFVFARWSDSIQNTFLICEKTPEGKRHDIVKGWYVLDVVKQPKRIQIVTAHEGGPGRQSLFGIYKFEGDRLTIAYRRGSLTSEQFESKPGSGVTLLTLQKEKPPETKEGAGQGGGMGMF